VSPDQPPPPSLPPGHYEVTRKALAGSAAGQVAGLWTYRLRPLVGGEAPPRAPDGTVEPPAGPDPYGAVFARASPHLAAGRVVVRLDGRRALLWFLPAGP